MAYSNSLYHEEVLERLATIPPTRLTQVQEKLLFEQLYGLINLFFF